MSPLASRTLATPIGIGAIALLVINDHVLKAAYPGVVTGKLSDVAGMIFFPLLLAAACEQLGLRRAMTTIVAAACATAVVFTAIKLSTTGGDAYRLAFALLQWPFRAARTLLHGGSLPAVGRARLTSDPTDLVTLCALVVPIALARRSMVRGERDGRFSRELPAHRTA
jgi:hypothetical protein